MGVVSIDEFVRAFGLQLDRGHASVFAGAGMSGYAQLPSWEDLVSPFAEKLGLADTPVDPVQLIQYAEDSPDIGRSQVESHVFKMLNRDLPDEPSVFHKLVADLPLRSVWTTNFDTLIERWANRNEERIRVFDRDEALVEGRDPALLPLYKMHGSVDVASGRMVDMVLSRADFEDYELTRPRFWALLQAEFLAGSILFLGFSFDDNNVESVFRMVRKLKLETKSNHYAVLRRPSKTGDVALHALRVREFEEVGVSVVEVDDFDEIDSILRTLSVRSRKPYTFVAGSQPQTDDPASGDGLEAYPTRELSAEIADFCTTLAHVLVGEDLPLRLLGASAVSASVGYELLRQARNSGRYRPEQFQMLRRVKDAPIDDDLRHRLGRIDFVAASSAQELREHALGQVRACVVIGGGAGTSDEVEICRTRQIGVVPVACTGGTALATWESMRSRLADLRLGGATISPDEFDRLNHHDVHTAARATVTLLRQAMFLD